MSDLPVVQTAYDMKAIIVLTSCDIMETLYRRGDMAGAYALKALVETIENIPCAKDASHE